MTQPPDVDALLRTLADREAELARAQALLDAAAQLARIGEIGAVLVHELNQPVFVIKGYIEMRQDGVLRGESLDHAWDAIGRAGDTAGTLVRTLRDAAAARLAAPEPFDVADAVAFGIRITPGSARVRVFGAPTVVSGSVMRVGQAVSALLDNALRADPGVIEVHFGTADQRAEIRVLDRGPGPAEAVRARMFKPLVTDREGAAGVGLSLALRIARDHGGDVQYEPRDGGGSVFVLSIESPRRA